MKLIAFYSIFNGCELLEASIKQIEPFVDKVIVCAQAVSNRGVQISTEDSDVLNRIDKTILVFQPDLNLSPKQNERNKLQMRIDYAKKEGYTHYIGLAADHFYSSVELPRAFELYKANPVDVTATYMYTYYKYPTWRLTPIETYLCPFICKIYPETTVSKSNYPFLTDPSVRISPAKSFMVYNRDEIMLHHYSMVRKDINSKFQNAASRQNFESRINEHLSEYENYNIKTNPGVGYFGGRKVEVVNNEFELPIE